MSDNNGDKEVKAAKARDAVLLLGPDDPFVQALTAERPQINPDYAVQSPVGYIREMTEEEKAGINKPEPEKLDQDKYGWAGNVHDYLGKMPDHWVPNNRFTSMTHYYPFHEPPHELVTKQADTLGPKDKYGNTILDHDKVSIALFTFFTTVKPSALATGCVMTYRGFLGEREAMFIRYERDHVDPMTFVLREDSYEGFIGDWYRAWFSPEAKQRAIDWAIEPNNDKEFQARGYMKRVCQKGQEFPLSWYWMMEHKHEYDGLLNGDFQLVDDLVDRFTSRFNRFIGIATKLADALAPKMKVRDHNLVLTFKGNKALDGLIIGLDKVPARLENGEFHLGETPIDLEEWAKHGNDVLVAARKINKVSNWVEQLLKECRSELPDHPYAKNTFDQAVKKQLLASSHFIKELYQIQASDIKPYVEKVANEIVEALNNKGGNIGLDLNTWYVYQYTNDGMAPVPLVSEGLNFRKTVYDVHTDRFIEILYTYMFGLTNPYIRPYTHKVAADPKDGIQIGSIRQIKGAPDPIISNREETPTPEKIEEVQEKGWDTMLKE